MILNPPFTHRLAPLLNDYFANLQNAQILCCNKVAAHTTIYWKFREYSAEISHIRIVGYIPPPDFCQGFFNIFNLSAEPVATFHLI